MIKSVMLQNAQSIEDAVEVVNTGTSHYNSDELAAQYAFDSATQAGYGISEETIKAHLNILSESGANFDHANALVIANNEE